MPRLLTAALVIQAALLFFRLDLLPVWTDERATITLAPEPPSRILDALRADVHPPLYMLMAHEWARLPLPGTLPVRLRALSGVLALLATCALYFLFLGREPPAVRKWFLLLWVLSPCLLLYGRMARSYTLQLLLAIVAFHAFERLLERPSRATGLSYSVCVALSLYVHYSTGGAVLAGCSAVLLWRWLRTADRRYGIALGVSLAAVAAALLPLAPALGDAVRRWATTGAHGVRWFSATEHAAKLGFTAFSFAFGETLPGWGLAAALAAPFVAAAAVSRARSIAPETALAGLAAYFAVSGWVTFPFMPARLLFLLPFLLLVLARSAGGAVRWTRWVGAGLAVLYVVSAFSYFLKTGYLNKAYAAPLEEMASVANQGASTSGTLFVVDYYNSDTLPFVDFLRTDVPLVLIDGPASAARVLAATGAGTSRIWYWRNTHDLSPGSLNENLEAELGRRYQTRPHLFVAYNGADRLLMRLLGWKTQPTHLYQLLEFTPYFATVTLARIAKLPPPSESASSSVQLEPSLLK